MDMCDVPAYIDLFRMGLSLEVIEYNIFSFGCNPSPVETLTVKPLTHKMALLIMSSFHSLSWKQPPQSSGRDTLNRRISIYLEPSEVSRP